MLFRNKTTEEKEYKKRACPYCDKELNIYPFTERNICFCSDCGAIVCYRDTDTEEEIIKKWRQYKGMGVWKENIEVCTVDDVKQKLPFEIDVVEIMDLKEE